LARELKDELSGETFGTETVQPEVARNPIQLEVSPELEKTLVDIIREDFESSRQARDKRDWGQTSKGEHLDFDSWIKKLRELYYGTRESKDVPWKFCSNRSLRISASILDMLHSRLFPAVVNEDLLRFRPGEVTDVPKVDRITKFMKWWIFVRSRMRGFFDEWVKGVLAYGDLITESSWKIEFRDEGKRESVPVTDDAGNALTNQDGTPALISEPVPRRLERTQSKIYMRDQFYLQDGSRNISEEPVILEETLFFRELKEGEARGTFVNIDRLKEKIPISEERIGSLDPADEERVKEIRIRNHPVKIHKWYGNFDADQDGFAERIRVYVATEYDLYLGATAISNIAYHGVQPLDYTKFDSRIDSPQQNLGEGILEKVHELSDELDAIFNQMTDANTLSVMRPGFYDPSGDLDAPVLKLAPNKITPVSDPSRNVFFPDFTIQVNQLIAAVRMVLEFIERLTAASSYVLGKESEIVGGSGTATRTQAIVQAAESRFALPAERLREGAARIVNHHLALVQLNIPPGLESRVLGEKGEVLFGPNELTQEGIAGEFDAYLLADPSMGSKETERNLASMLYSILLQNMIVGSDPVKIYKVTANLLKAYDINYEEFLGPEPASDMIDDPRDENTLIVQGDFERVKAQITENHILHIQKHMELLESPTLASLPPHLVNQIQEFTKSHLLEHQGMMQAMIGIISKIGGVGGGTKSNAGGSEGTRTPSGVGQIEGPLGAALESKREGEGGSYTPGPPV